MDSMDSSSLHQKQSLLDDRASRASPNTESQIARNRNPSSSRNCNSDMRNNHNRSGSDSSTQMTPSFMPCHHGNNNSPVIAYHDLTNQPPVSKVGDETKAERQRIKHRLMVSTAVTLLCYITGVLSLVPVQAQYLYQWFAHDYFNLTNVTDKQVPCSESANDSLQETLNQIQADTSQQTLLMDFAQYVPAMFVTLFLGSYTDYLGRRFMVIMPCLGAFLKSVVFLLVIYLELDINYLYIAYALDGLCGSLYALTLGLTAAVADTTSTTKERALNFILLEGSLAVAGSISQIGAGLLIDAVGYVAPAVVITVLLFLAVISVTAFMPETLQPPTEVVLSPTVHLKKVFGFYTVDGTVRQRCLFLCGLLSYFFIILVMLGKMSVETLYEINSPFCWDSVQIGLFGGLKMLVQVSGSIIAVKVLQACIRIEFIALLGLLSAGASYLVEAFAFADWMMYLVPVVGIIAMVVSPVVRTLMSRMAPANSQGALFASMSTVETICHLASTTMYNTVYTATLSVFSGFVFLLMAAFCFINIFIIIVFMIVSRKTVFLESVIEVESPQPEDVGERTPLLSGHEATAQ